VPFEALMIDRTPGQGRSLASTRSLDHNADVLTSDSGGFTFEKDVVAALERGAASALNLTGWTKVLREVRVRQRIADMVVIHASAQPLSKKTRVSYFEAAIVSELLQNGELPLAEVAHRLYSCEPSIDARASKLARLGLIDYAGDVLRPNGRDLVADVEIVAIEAKLTRWREAVEQATRYLEFANRSYIAMPAESFIAADPILSACAGAGVGALSVAADETVTLLMEARHREPQTTERVRLVSSFVGVAHSENTLRHVD
jgi:DNA-binding Lrp family transcriptional regulator